MQQRLGENHRNVSRHDTLVDRGVLPSPETRNSASSYKQK